MLPIEEIFFVVIQWVNMGSEDIVSGAPNAGQSNEEAFFSRLASEGEETTAILI